MKILAVDDDFVSLTKTMAVLQPYGHCHAATNGPQAIQMFAEAIALGDPYNLITLDIEMPCVSGLDVLKTVRQREVLRQIRPARIIMLTGASSRTNVQEAAGHRCDAFLIKPVTREALTAALARLGIEAPSQETAEAPSPTAAPEPITP